MGYVSGQAEKGYTPAVALIDARSRFAADRAPQRFERGHLDGLAVAGRLDIDSQGLLVLTQDGRIAKQLIGEDSEVDKEYLVRVQGSLSDRGLELLNHGLSLDGRPCGRPGCAGRTTTSCASCCARASVRSAACASWSASRWWA